MILSYLNDKLGLKKAKAIYELIWPSSLNGMNQKRSSLKKLIENQLNKYYPNDVEKINNIHELESIIGASRKAITNWIKEYLFKKYNDYTAIIIYNTIWSKKTRKKINFEYLQNLIEKKGG